MMFKHSSRLFSLALVATTASGCTDAALDDPLDDEVATVASASSVNGDISAAEILDRARFWYELCNDASKADCTANGMWYTTERDGDSDSHADPGGKQYRKDCSGYVSMALHLDASYVTSTLPSVLTTIDPDLLQPGDVVDSPVGGHTFLFEKWGDAAHTVYYAYDFGTTPIRHRTVHRSGSDLDTSDSRTFFAYHYPRNTGGSGSSGRGAPAMAYDKGDGTMMIYRWTSSGAGFSHTTDYQSGPFSLANVGDRVAAGDVDGDGHDDVVMAYQYADGTFGFYVFTSAIHSDGVWFQSGSFGLDHVGGRLVVDDFNGDGRAEPALVYDVGDGTMRIYRWLSTGSSFTRTTDYTSGTFRLSHVGDRVASGDVNGDGKADIVMAYQADDGTFSFYVFTSGATSDGRWYDSGVFSLANVAGRLVVDDFDGDGRAEPALVYDLGTTMRIYRWSSTGTSFARATDYTSGPFSLGNVGNRVASRDVDGDGKADIVMAYQQGDGTFSYYVFDRGAASAGRWYDSGSYDLGRVAGRLVLGRW